MSGPYSTRHRNLPLPGLLLRSLRLSLHFLLFALVFVSYPLYRSRLPGLAGWWYSKLLRILNIEVLVRGPAPAKASLVVANHVSWLDIVLLGGLLRGAFVSKAEVRRWPMVGHFAALLGTVFLPRGQFQTAEAARRMQAALARGQHVVLFPSATTIADLLPPRFHARMFAAAIEGNFPVQPLAIHYLPDTGEQDCHDPLATWAGTAELAPHFLRLCRIRGLRVVVTYCPPLVVAGQDRRSLANACHQAITQSLTQESAP